MRRLFLILILAIAFAFPGQSQVPPKSDSARTKPPLPQSAAATTKGRPLVTYVSDLDRALAIDRIALLPIVDNVEQIYSRPLTQSMFDFFNQSHQWIPIISKSKVVSENLSPDEVIRAARENEAQAVLAGRLWKGPNGVQMRLVLYLAGDGLPLLIDSAENIQDFATEKLSFELKQRLINIYQRLPAQGRLLSRRGNDVTLNLGTFHGVSAGDTVNVIQVVSVERHPKNKFMLSHQKVLLGQVRLTTADEFLSFGQISMEKEAGVIQVNSNIKPDQFIKYTLADDGSMVTLRDRLEQRPDSDVSFGKKPEEWRPKPQPQYGRLQLALGLLQYNQNLSLQTAGSLSASTSLGPTISLSGEAWLNEEWFLDMRFRQSAFSVSNGLGGSSPGSLNMSLNQYHIAGGYNILIEDNFWGPKLQLTMGIAQLNIKADDSTPIFLTSMNYGGMYLGFRGGTPLWDESPMSLGLQFKYFLTNSLTESKSSGSASGVKINEFGIFGTYKTKSGYHLLGELNFDYLSSSFSGTGNRTTDPASSISHKVTTALFGIEYFF